MIRLQYILIASLLILIFILGLCTWNTMHVPEPKLVQLHISAVRKGIEKDSTACHEHITYFKNRIGGLSDLKFIRSINLMDSLLDLEDSTHYYLNRMIINKNNEDSAKWYYNKYGRFSVNATKFINDRTGMEDAMSSLGFEENLPGKRIPLKSPDGIEVLALLLIGESYHDIQRALSDVMR